ncbi:MAG TPA: hypothetical protein VGI19_01060 [Candidatus Cybelea sp.]|jgi:hypothetical protein
MMIATGRLLLAGILLGALCFGSVALAAVDLSAGIRYVSPSGTLADCSAKAKAALEAYFPGATESEPGSGNWIVIAQNPTVGAPTAAASVRCFQLSKGFVATFICSVQVPTNPYSASALCLDVAHKFYGGALTPLAAMPTATPVPTGCATNNLVGTWVSDSDPKLTFTMGLNGDLTDSEGVSGNWIIDGNKVTLTYYGNHTMTLSADGKHLSGGGYNLTRKC